MTVQRIESLSFDVISSLIQASTGEGYMFVRRLWDEYESGVNRFDSAGAVLLGIYENGHLIGIGGICRDPYLKDDTIGRVQHVYVCPEHRRNGIGRALVMELIKHASKHFDVLTLRTPTAHGDAFYTSLGFRTEPQYESATHWMFLRTMAQAQQ